MPLNILKCQNKFENLKKAQKYRHSLTLLVPGDFSTLMYQGGMFFHPPLKNDFLPQESIIFHPEIKFGIILEVF